jgi:signal transduction histidine kinase
LFFGNQAVNNKITDFIHPKDLRLFHETVTRVMGSYNFTPATIEVRIKREPRQMSCSLATGCPAPLSRAPTPPTNQRRASANRVYCVDDSASRRSLASNSGPESPRSANRTHSTPSYANTREVDDDGYIWIECTLCKGARMNRGSEFEYDVKMVARNIDDRKKRAQYQTMIESTEEKERINESKMRYISCIAHDLKTPLQSFCFTMDLLGQTRLHTEQRDFVQQALVAVDLMKLTISQTMDISKALTGAKLLPRRTTVYLSSVIQRVKVIM